MLPVLFLQGALGRFPWMDTELTPRERAEQLLTKMTDHNKQSIIHGVPGSYIGNIPAIPELGIPSLNMQDGPQGFRAPGHDGTTTQWPSGLTMACSWDTDLVEQWTRAMAQEFKGKGANVVLGPGLNVARVPVNGRNFEYLSGEDPFLGSSMVVPYVRGVQSQGLIANAKHWVHNNQETNRKRVSAYVNEKTQWEIYYPPFQAAVDAGVYSVMCAYNKVNGTSACENDYTLNTDLKGRMKFEGWVMSDWFATTSGVPAAKSGLDQEMPTGIFFGTMGSQIPKDRLNDMALRILTPMFAAGIFDRPQTGNLTANVTSADHNALARRFAAESTILLKNEGGLLPLSVAKLSGKKVAVVGAAAQDDLITGGTGSGHVSPAYTISPLQGIRNALTGANVTYYNGKSVAAAVAGARQSDLVIVVVGTTSGEAVDRHTLGLAAEDNSLITAVGEANPRTVAVVYAPGAVLLPFEHEVGAILLGMLPGQEQGNALADVLIGKVNPAARLPITIPNKDNEVGFTTRQYPGIDFDTYYDEQLYIGYRWYDASGVKPHFPFGFGLSYTTFQYSGLQLTTFNGSAALSLKVTNVGPVAGRDVPQLYLRYPSSYEMPAKQLRGFSKTPVLAPNATAVMYFPLTPRVLSIWNTKTHAWEKVVGSVVAMVGPHSGYLPLTLTIN